MQGSNIPVQQWLYAMYLMKINKKGISSIALSKELGITQKSAWYMAQKIRECFVDFIKLSGTIEMDETFIGGKEKNKHADKKLKQGRGTIGKTPVMGALQRDTKKVIAYPVKEVTTSTVGAFMRTHIKKQSDVIADEFPAYDKYTMLRVNHSKGEWVDKECPEIHTNNIESYWAIVKRGQMGVYHWWSDKHLYRYMREYTYRFNHKRGRVVDFISSVLHNGKNKVRNFKNIRA